MTKPINEGVRDRLLGKLSGWREKALCLTRSQNNPELMKIWVDPKSEFHDLAESICDRCPVRKQCVLDALDDRNSEGIRAGVYFYSGKVNDEGVKKIREKFPEIPFTLIRKKYADRANVETDEDL